MNTMRLQRASQSIIARSATQFGIGKANTAARQRITVSRTIAYAAATMPALTGPSEVTAFVDKLSSDYEQA